MPGSWLLAATQAEQTVDPDALASAFAARASAAVSPQALADLHILGQREHPFWGIDGRGRAFDNIFVEQLWRNVKNEDVYL